MSLERRILTIKEAIFAYENALPVYYEETYHNPNDQDKNHNTESILKKGDRFYYIGGVDLELDCMEEHELAFIDLVEFFVSIESVAGVKYE